MLIQVRSQKARHALAEGFSLVESLFAFTLLALSVGGIVYGYAQVSRMAQWSAMSGAAQSYALQGMEQARAAQWNPWDTTGTGQGTENQMTAPSVTTQQDLLDIPMKGNPFSTNSSGAFTNTFFYATNYITVTPIYNYKGGLFQANLRQISSVVYWTFPVYNTLVGTNLTVKLFSNTVVTLRASDQ